MRIVGEQWTKLVAQQESGHLIWKETGHQRETRYFIWSNRGKGKKVQVLGIKAVSAQVSGLHTASGQPVPPFL